MEKDLGIMDAPVGFDILARHQQMKLILEKKTAYLIDEILVDIQTANVYLMVYKGLSEESRKKLEELPLVQAVNICWKMVKRKET